MPKQIFTSAHKKSIASSDNALESRYVLKSVRGLRWGVFTGSPQLSKPRIIDKLKLTSKLSKLVMDGSLNMFYGLPDKCHLMRSSSSDNHDLVIWSESDGIVRVKSLKDETQPTKKLFHIASHDPVTACGSHLKYSNLWFGHQSGNISVYVRLDEKLPTKQKQKNTRTFNDALEAIIGIKEANVDNGAEDDEPLIKSKGIFRLFL